MHKRDFFVGISFLEQRRLWAFDVSDMFEENVEEGATADASAVEGKLDRIKIGGEDIKGVNLEKLNSTQFAEALNKINQAAETTYTKFFDKAYSGDAVNAKRGSANTKIFEMAAAEAKNGEQRNITKVFNDYLEVFEVLDQGEIGNIIRADGSKRGALKGEKNIDLKNKLPQGYTAKTETDGSVIITYGTKTLTYKTGIKFLRPIKQNEKEVGVFLIDGDGDCSILGADGKASYVESRLLAEARKNGNGPVYVNEGLNWFYNLEGGKGGEKDKLASKQGKEELGKQVLLKTYEEIIKKDKNAEIITELQKEENKGLIDTLSQMQRRELVEKMVTNVTSEEFSGTLGFEYLENVQIEAKDGKVKIAFQRNGEAKELHFHADGVSANGTDMKKDAEVQNILKEVIRARTDVIASDFENKDATKMKTHLGITSDDLVPTFDGDNLEIKRGGVLVNTVTMTKETDGSITFRNTLDDIKLDLKIDASGKNYALDSAAGIARESFKYEQIEEAFCQKAIAENKPKALAILLGTEEKNVTFSGDGNKTLGVTKDSVEHSFTIADDGTLTGAAGSPKITTLAELKEVLAEGKS